MCFVSEMLFSLYPIFAFTPVRSGGLGVSEAVIGTHMAIRSLLPIPMMLFYPRLQRRLGTVHVYQIVMAGFPVVVLFFPLLNLLIRASAPSWIVNLCLFGYFVTWSWCGFAWRRCSFNLVRYVSKLICCLATSSIMVNDVASSPEALASLNVSFQKIRLSKDAYPPQGISQMAIVLPQAIAPAVSTALFAVSIRSHILDGYSIWALLFVIGKWFVHQI
jgi:hypothetical protein